MRWSPGIRAVFYTMLAAGAAATARAQETPASPPPEGAAAPHEAAPYRPIEGNVIIDLPSVDVPREGTLTMLFTHRFQQPVQDSTIHDLYSFDNGANIGIGLWYAPIKNLNAGFYRSSDLDVYELSAQYQVPISAGGFGASVRLGEDWRTEQGVASPHTSFFAQAILAYSFGPYVRITAVPTYLQRTNGVAFNRTVPPPNDESCHVVQVGIPPVTRYSCSGLYEDLFNVPFAASIAITHSITLHGEVTPSLGKANSQGVAWVVSLEKTLLRHRFAFTAGNQRRSTVDQYLVGIPQVANRPKDIFLGFNIMRQWKLK